MTDERRQARWILLLALTAWAAVAAPLAVGSRTFYLRDVLSVHAPWKAFGAEALRNGSVPAFNPTWGLGQPFRGNPNALPFYPDNLLYLGLPFWIAFNLHYALHWLLAFFSFRALARALGMRELAAATAAVTYAGSGYVLSCLTFYNLIAFVAWWPLVVWGAVVGGRRGLAVGGLACGLAILAGEPVTFALALVPLALAAAQSRGRRGILAAGVVVGAGIVVALPQLVAAARVAGFTYRGAHGLLASQAASFTLSPLRWIELLVPLPFGSPARIGVGGWWATKVSEGLPLFFSLYLGCVGLVLALVARGRRRWLALAVVGWFLAWALGISGEALVRVTGGLFRYPEKLLFWPAFGVALLAGWGLETLAETPRRAVRAFAAAAGGATLLLATVLAARGPLLAAAAGGTAETAEVAALSAATAGWMRDLALGSALLVGAAWCALRQRAVGIALLQFAALLQLHSLAATAPARAVRGPIEWEGLVPAGSGIVNPAMVHPLWEPVRFDLGDRPAWARTDVERQALSAFGGVTRGWHYPLAPDIEGTQSPLHSLVLYNLPKFDLGQRLRWLRILGGDRLVLYRAASDPGLEVLARGVWSGKPSWLYAVRGVVPPVWRPDAVEVATSPAEALRRVTFGEGDPVTRPVVSAALEQESGGGVEPVRESAAEIELRSHGPGGLVVVRRAYQPLYRARAGNERLSTMPVDLTLLGIVVPAGEQTIRIDVPAWPEALSGALSVPFAGLLVGLAWRRR